MIKRNRPRFLAVMILLLCALVLAAAPVAAVSIGVHDVTFEGYLNNYPGAGQSTWFYAVASNSGGGGPNISHTTFALGECLTVVAAGTWSGSLPNPTLNQLYSGTNNSSVQVGTDPTTGVTGIKFDTSVPSGQTVYYYFTVTGAVGIGTNTVALKAGPGFVSGPVDGPSCDEVDPPLAVVLSDFAAVCQAETPLITWETVMETETAGFNLYRGSSAESWDTQLNSTMIPAQAPGSAAGGSYQWVDSAAQVNEAHFYWLQDVSLDGATAMHGPVSVDCSAPTAVGLNSLTAEGAASELSLGWAAVLAGIAAVAGLVSWRRWAGRPS